VLQYWRLARQRQATPSGKELKGSTVARCDEQRRAGCELEGEGGFADLLHDCEDKGVEESAHGAVVTDGV
jgi:hypothetical protein